MFGSETLTIVTSMISSSVAVMTAMLMMTRRSAVLDDRAFVGAAHHRRLRSDDIQRMLT